jgi:hypothetical protein
MRPLAFAVPFEEFVIVGWNKRAPESALSVTCLGLSWPCVICPGHGSFRGRGSAEVRLAMGVRGADAVMDSSAGAIHHAAAGMPKDHAP